MASVVGAHCPLDQYQGSMRRKGNEKLAAKVAVPGAMAAAAPAVTALHDSSNGIEGIQYLTAGEGGSVQTLGPPVASKGRLEVNGETGTALELHSGDLAMQDAGLKSFDGAATEGAAAIGFEHSHNYQQPNLTPPDNRKAKGFAEQSGVGLAVAASNHKFGGAQRLEVNLTQQTAPGVFTVTHLRGDTSSGVLRVTSVGPAQWSPSSSG